MSTELKPEADTKSGQLPSSMIRLISDLGPAIVFFVAYNFANKNGVPSFAAELSNNQATLFATLMFVPAAIAGFVFSYLQEKKVSPLGLFIFVLVCIISALGIWLKNDIFIKMRPTLIYALMGGILIVSVLASRNLLKTLFAGALHLPEPQWRSLAVRAGVMYLSLAAINEAVWRTQSEKDWVFYNTWGDTTINLIFWMVNMVFLAKYFTDEHGNSLMDEVKSKE
jgi:intracellular septation protein